MAFSPRGYFLTEYGSHDVQNCYSVLEAWSPGEELAPTETTSEPSGGICYNPSITGVLVVAVVLAGVLLWRKRS